MGLKGLGSNAGGSDPAGDRSEPYAQASPIADEFGESDEADEGVEVEILDEGPIDGDAPDQMS